METQLTTQALNHGSFLFFSLIVYSTISTPLILLIHKYRIPPRNPPNNAPLRQQIHYKIHNNSWIFPILSAIIGLIYMDSYVYDTMFGIPISKWSKAGTSHGTEILYQSELAQDSL
ncbi:hypothetical protein E2P81_ATG03456 [Venturia nashicola]|nr:hypothetical protein E2P81_ATG03456 [Venturia nashicola]